MLCWLVHATENRMSVCFLQIEDGEIFATINQKDGMVIFHDDPEKYNSPVMLRQLEEEVSWFWYVIVASHTFEIYSKY